MGSVNSTPRSSRPMRSSLRFLAGEDATDTEDVPSLPYVPNVYPYTENRNVPVLLYAYDLTTGWARIVSVFLSLVGKTSSALFIPGAIWHTSIVVFGKEYTYVMDDGIQVSRPREPDRFVELGQTTMSERRLYEFLLELQRNQFHPANYDVLTTNCRAFANIVCEFLIGRKIPAEYRTFGETPIGRLMREHEDGLNDFVRQHLVGERPDERRISFH